ncbi:trehalose-phosphatase [Deinococcus peraridilitoris]|uniref:Trehalose 6-phosphate phosphatase n=1 Tax=Deinococcus peraridilitoris (strain DSM 19664 / LMG 22246 / CIP 109416 / KR-200) TaxID=937777 RepID=K9ZXA5_DEIPD|nr:trehalose-phosphatase [Deinococcus peraridilitoris]AFZ66196.1 trehalose-phosphatase [Deinococcus peraridilitoris DSM 19664]
MTLPEALVRLADWPLLILCDYDGTLAPIVARPEDARPEEGARAALQRLLHHPRHEVAVITGRSVAAAQGFLNTSDLTVIGLHGMEWPGEPPPRADREALSQISRQLQPLIDREGVFANLPGLRLEDKGWTMAVHYRNAPAELHAAIEDFLTGVNLPPGWETVEGKKVHEFRPGGFGKGRAALTLARRFPEHHPVFLGDDVTDEEAFAAVLALDGTAVKVGEGETLAPHRLDSPAWAVALLEHWAGQEA